MADKIQTPREEIVSYWQDKVYEGDLGVDFCDALRRCWRCGEAVAHEKLHRCHIIPAQSGGLDTPSNFVLLCRACHEEAPSFDDDKDAMWTWIKATRCPTYGQFWYNRTIAEFNNLYGRVPQLDRVKRGRLERIFSTIGVHLGGRIISSSSKAITLYKAGA